MIKNRYKGKHFYKKQLNKVFIALLILLFILMAKKINISFTNKVIRIIDKSIKYEFNVKSDGKKILGFSKKVLKLPKKAISVFNTNDGKNNYIAPVDGKVQNSSNESKGINIVPNVSEEVLSIGKGTITRIEDRKDLGYYVTVNYKDFDAIYGQLNKVNVSMGDIVFKGEKIGVLGELNGKKKPLYFEIWKDGNPVNPMEIVKSK